MRIGLSVAEEALPTLKISEGKLSPPLLRAHTLKLTTLSFSMVVVKRGFFRSEEHTSELQSRQYLVCRLLLENKNITDADGDAHGTHVRDIVVATKATA